MLKHDSNMYGKKKETKLFDDKIETKILSFAFTLIFFIEL